MFRVPWFSCPDVLVFLKEHFNMITVQRIIKNGHDTNHFSYVLYFLSNNSRCTSWGSCRRCYTCSPSTPAKRSLWCIHKETPETSFPDRFLSWTFWYSNGIFFWSWFAVAESPFCDGCNGKLVSYLLVRRGALISVGSISPTPCFCNWKWKVDQFAKL